MHSISELTILQRLAILLVHRKKFVACLALELNVRIAAAGELEDRMGVTVDVYTWPEAVVAAGAELTLLHWVVDGNGHSLIEPDRWHWMSAVPEYTDVRPDRPVPAATIHIIAQRPVRERRPSPGPASTNWLATWRNPGQDSATFRPRMVVAPAR